MNQNHIMRSPNPPQDSRPMLQPKRWVVGLFTVFPLLAIGLGYVLDDYARPFLIDWLRQRDALDPAGTPLRNAVFLASLLGLMAATTIGMASYFWLMAFRTLRTEAFPPRGYPILAPTQTLVGPAAIKKGRRLVFEGIIAFALGTYVIWSIFSIFPEFSRILRPLWKALV